MEARRRALSQPPVLVLMGVSGSGKSSVGGALAGLLGWELGEGDELHPQENIDKMASGHPLTDDDRWPWLALVRGWIHEHEAAGEPAIVTCSALKRAYRDALRDDHVLFVYLCGDPALLRSRLQARRGHYMPVSLLDSQLADLEPPGPDENAITVDVGPPPLTLAEQIATELGLAPAGYPPDQPRGAEDSSQDTNPV